MVLLAFSRIYNSYINTFTIFKMKVIVFTITFR